MSERSPISGILRSMPWPLAEAMAALFTGAASVFIIARLIGADEFGRGSISFGIILVMVVGVNSLVHDALVRLPNLEPEDIDVGFTASMGAAVLFTAIAALAAHYIGDLYRDQRMALLVWGFIPLLPLAALSETLIAERRRALDFRLVAKTQISGRIIGGLLGIAAAAYHMGAWSLVVQYVTSAAFIAAVMVRRTKHRPRFRLSWRRLVPMLSFCGPIIGSQLMAQGTSRLILLAIGHWHGLAVAGYWSAATRISENLFGGLLQAAYNVGLAHFSLKQNSREALLSGLRDAQAITALLSIPLLVGLAAAAQPLTLLLLGQAWAPVASLMYGPLIVAFLQIRRMFPTTTLRALGRSGVSLVSSVLEAVTLLAAFFVWGRASAISMNYIYPLGVLVGSLPIFALLVQEVGTTALQQSAVFLKEIAIGAIAVYIGFELGAAMEQSSTIITLFAVGGASAIAATVLLLLSDLRLVMRIARADHL